MILEFPAPARTPSINQVNGEHWARYYEDKKAWQGVAKLSLRLDASIGLPLSPSKVTVTIPFKQNRRRDPHNYVGTVVKWIIDGLVYACAWPDDTPEWVTVIEPVLVKDSELMVKVEIEAR